MAIGSLSNGDSGSSVRGKLNSAIAGVNLRAIASTSALASLSGQFAGDVARVVSERQFGHFKWHTGDCSSQVTADANGGLWVAGAGNATGASGAWQRMVEKDIYDTEWWLPDTMPSNAQVRLNALFSALPSSARKLVMPRRTVTLTGTVILAAGIEYEGAGRGAAFNGGGGGFFPISIAASNAKLWNISSGNVTGTAVQGEPGGFHITDGLALLASDGIPIENVSLRDCHGFDARTGLRVGYKSTGTLEDTVVYGSRDTYVENFHCDGIDRIGIETMRAHGVEIVGSVLRLTLDDSTGIKRGVRIVGAHNITVLGTRIVQSNDTGTASGVSIERAANFSSSSGSSDVTCEAVVTENCRGQSFRIDQGCCNISISNCQGIGRTDAGDSDFLFISTSMVEGEQSKDIVVHNNKAVNVAIFMRFTGRIVGITVTNNNHISNDAATPRFLVSSGNAANDELIEALFARNRGIAKAGASGGYFRYAGMNANSSITVDDNEFTADAVGNVFSFTGDGVVQMKRRDSNKTLPSTLWAAIRPALDLEVYV